MLTFAKHFGESQFRALTNNNSPSPTKQNKQITVFGSKPLSVDDPRGREIKPVDAV